MPQRPVVHFPTFDPNVPLEATMTTVLIIFALLAQVSPAPTASPAAEKEEGFHPLFNGKDTTGWHLRYPRGQNSWSIEKGVLKNTAGGDVHGTDLVTDQKFRDFTVRFEYMV